MSTLRTTILFIVYYVLLTGSNLLAVNTFVTAATGGANIPADTRGGAFTTLTGPILREFDKNGISVGTIILNVPAGFEFDASASVRVSVSGKGKGSDLVLSNEFATVTTNTITVSITTLSSNQRKSTLTWSGIRVRPTAGFPLARGNITKSGTSSYTESGSIGNYGTLNESAGAVSNLVITLPNQTFTSGSGVTGTPSPQTAGVPFNLKGITAADQFLNIATNYSGVSVIQYSGPGGSPSYTTNITFTNGVSSNMLATVLRKAEATSITAGNGIIAGPASSLLTVHPGPFAKLQLLLPGETAAPGTSTGKTGTPLSHVAGSSFTVTVYAVDADWNPLTNVTDTVSISLSDTNAVAPAPAAMSGGMARFIILMPTAGARHDNGQKWRACGPGGRFGLHGHGPLG